MARGDVSRGGPTVGAIFEDILQRRGVSYSGERRGGGRGAKSAVRANSKATDRVEDVLNLSREDVEE
jgi:hypothetical protein